MSFVILKTIIMLHGYRRLYSLHKKIDIHVGIAKYVEKIFGASNYELGRSLLRGKSKK